MIRAITAGLVGLSAAGVTAPVAAAPSQGVAKGIDKAEFQSAVRTRMLKGDADGDGKLSRAEWIAQAKARAGGRNPAAAFDRLDGNGDGFLDASEIDALAARRFARLDADGNGLVTPEERGAGRRGARD